MRTGGPGGTASSGGGAGNFGCNTSGVGGGTTFCTGGVTRGATSIACPKPARNGSKDKTSVRSPATAAQRFNLVSPPIARQRRSQRPRSTTPDRGQIDAAFFKSNRSLNKVQL